MLRVNRNIIKLFDKTEKLNIYLFSCQRLLHLHRLLSHVGEWNLHGELDGVEELYHHVGNHLETWLPLPARHHVATDVEGVEQVRLPSVVGGNYEVGSDVVLPGML